MFLDFAQPFVLPPYGLSVLTVADLKDKPHQCPLRMKWEDEEDWWTLPFDPVISVSGGNTIIRTDVLRQDNGRSERRGTVKEVWSQQDYQVQIAGMFIGSGNFPENDVRRLRYYCEERKVVEVACELLQVFGINRIAIESYDFAHTPGSENQQFAIKAYSDEEFSLLI